MVKRKLCVSVSVCLRFACVCAFVCVPVRCLCVYKVSLPCVYVQYVCFWWMHSSSAMVLKLCDLVDMLYHIGSHYLQRQTAVCLYVWSIQDAMVSLYHSFILPLSFSPFSVHLLSGLAPPHLDPSIITASPPL